MIKDWTQEEWDKLKDEDKLLFEKVEKADAEFEEFKTRNNYRYIRVDSCANCVYINTMYRGGDSDCYLTPVSPYDEDSHYDVSDSAICDLYERRK